MAIIYNKNYINSYEKFSPAQEADLLKMGVPVEVVEVLDRSLWAVLSGEPISKFLTVFEAAELAVTVDEVGKLPLIGPLKSSLKVELGIVC